MAGRAFGNVRRLPSGRWQARYLGANGRRRQAPHTFDTKTAAARWLPLTESELCRWLLRKHIAPHLGGVELGRLTTALVRKWRTDLLDGGASQSMTAKAYRLLRAVLNTAVVEDRIIREHPRRVRGADRENAGERPVPTMAQVFALADRMPTRFRVLILVTASPPCAG